MLTHCAYWWSDGEPLVAACSFKLTRTNGPKWLMQSEYFLEGQGLSGLVVYPHATKTGWLYDSSRSAVVEDSSRHTALPEPVQGPSFWQLLDDEEALQAASSRTLLRPSATGGGVPAAEGAFGGGEGGAETPSASAQGSQSLPGESIAEQIAKGCDEAERAH